MKNEKGYVYIMTNPSFRDDWVKIGFAKDVEKRRRELSGATGVPLPFEIFAKMKTEKYQDVEKTLHHMIDGITELRINKNREFFNITPETAFELFRDLAKIISDAELAKMNSDDDEVESDENLIKSSQKRAMSGINTTFDFLKIPVGTELTFRDDNTIKAIVLNNKNQIQIIDGGREGKGAVSTISQKLYDELDLWGDRSTHTLSGWYHWLYKGEMLYKIRERIIREKEIQKREEEK